jgi:threonine dehydrogenase-like Zn-dependent dehydrogenase
MHGHEIPNLTMSNLVKSVRATGALGVVGVSVPKDPGSPDPLAKDGQIAFNPGLFFQKGLRMGCGQTNVKAYNRRLCERIHQGRARPSFIVSHHLPLDQAPDAYAHCGRREQGWTKVLLKPAA